MDSTNSRAARVGWRDLAAEPFRIFFPAAVAVGLAGVSLWPLYSLKLADFYPGTSHARLMACGFFGGFIVGFLGTALPRMLSSLPLTVGETAVSLGLFLTMAAAYARSKIVLGDKLFLAWLGFFALGGAVRFCKRKDTPPPGFVLVLLGLLCAAAGAVLAIADADTDEARYSALQHLLSYQGFILFPILGVGAFILPRFFGLPGLHDMPESRPPTALWVRKAGAAAAAVILISFFIEAAGWHRLGPALRFAGALVYIAFEIPVFHPTAVKNAFSGSLKVAFALLLAGFAGAVIYPGYRVALLHLTLVGGFAAVTFVVATRVIFGHSGNLALMSKPNRWLWVALGTMWFAMITRISGDFLPKIRFSHYAYGALVWIIGVLIWAWKVLGKVTVKDVED
ncbi:MAG: NnrS family protein [Verrucomicrobiota bacterium]|jgi:uncharacterized protein involved in response to NO